MATIEISSYEPSKKPLFGGNRPGRGHSPQAAARITDIGPRNSQKSFQKIKKTAERFVADKIEKILLSANMETPLEFVLSEMNNRENEIAVRLECARLALPYIHRRKPIEVEQVETPPEEKYEQMKITSEALQDLSLDDLAALNDLSRKLAQSRADRAGDSAPEEVEAQLVLPAEGAPAEGAVPEAHAVLPDGGDPS